MATFPTVPSVAAGGLLRLSDVQAMYDAVAALVQPPQIMSAVIPPSLNDGSGYTTFSTTSTTDVLISSNFDLGLVTDGRRALVTFNGAINLSNPSATQIAIAELSLYVDGVKQANSVWQFHSPVSSQSISAPLTYSVITPVLSAAYHTFTLKTRIVSGLSTPTVYYIISPFDRMTVRAY